MSLYTISPQPWLIFLDDGGLYLPNGQLAIYQAGTMTPAPVYTTEDGIAHPFPITLDGTGRIPSGLYLQPGLSYKFVLHAPQIEEPLDGAILRSQDHVAASGSAGPGGGSTMTLAIGGDYSNLNVAGVRLIEYTGAGDVIFRGFTGGVPGQSIVIKNLSSTGRIWLSDGDGTAPAGASLINFIAEGSTPITNVRGTAHYIYLSPGAWGMDAHAMGGPIYNIYDGSVYGTTQPGGIWTVEQTDLYGESFYIEGNVMFYSFFLQDTSLNIDAAMLTRKMPFDWRGGTIASTNMYISLSGGPAQAGVVIAADSFTMGFQRLPYVPFPAGTNHITLIGQIAFPLA